MVKRCGNCGKEIQDNRNFETHIQRCMFNRTKTLVCERCNRRYSYRSSMYLHKRQCEGLGDVENEEQAKGSVTGSRILMKEKIRTRFAYRMINKPTSQGSNNVEGDNSQSNENFKYVMCMRTKTIHLVNDYKVESETKTEVIDTTETDTNTYLHHNTGIENVPTDKIKSDNHNDNEMNEFIVEEVPLDCNQKESSNGEEVVVLEDFGYFNKVEVRNIAIKMELSDPLEEFQES